MDSIKFNINYIYYIITSVVSLHLYSTIINNITYLGITISKHFNIKIYISIINNVWIKTFNISIVPINFKNIF